MSAPAAAASSSAGNKRGRPDPVSLLWDKLGLLVQDIRSDLKGTGPSMLEAFAARRKAALPGLRSVVDTEGWATRGAIDAAVIKLEEALELDKGMGWCEEARARLGTIRLLLDSQGEAQQEKKAKSGPATRDVVHLLHVHLDRDDLFDELWTIPVADAAAFKAAFQKCEATPDRAGGALLAVFDRSTSTVEEMSSLTALRENERVLWTAMAYHGHKPDCLNCMLCAE